MGKRKARQHYGDDFKRQTVAETYEPGVSVSVVARRHDINANLLFRWRDDPRYSGGVNFLPIEIDAVAGEDVSGNAILSDKPTPSELAIWIAGDVRLAVKGDYDPSVLGALIRSVWSPA